MTKKYVINNTFYNRIITEVDANTILNILKVMNFLIRYVVKL